MEQKSFQQLKNRFFRSPFLRCADSSLPYELSADATEVGAGAVLTETDEAGGRPVAFCSRKLNDAVQGYSTHERELLDILNALRTWRS